jgi:D-sedoheptulose 7-phosphate isomerase
MAGSDMTRLASLVAQQLKESADVKLQLAAQAEVIVEMANIWAAALQRGNKILFCGNGGSAADSQHLAAELVGHFEKERQPFPAMALTTDTSILTAVANDYGYERIFERQVAGHGRPGDVLVGISTSGQSENVIRAIEKARAIGMISMAFTGASGKLTELADYTLSVPSTSTPRIQEAHIAAGHIMCGLIDELIGGHVADRQKAVV